jgi:hypothetical protein
LGIWVLVAVGVLIVAAALYLEVQRRQALARTASALGFQLTSGQHRLPAALDGAGFYLFTQGPPLIQNRMVGARGGYRVWLFDFSFPAEKGEEGSRDLPVGDVGQVENRMQTVVWLQRAGQVLPGFDLSPTRQVPRRIGGPTAMRRVAFDGRADFDARYLLFARDETAARRIFTPRVLDAWVGDPGWFVEGRGDQWLVYRLSERVSARAIPAFLDRAIGLVERLAAP